jgi:hypothetical protein
MCRMPRYDLLLCAKGGPIIVAIEEVRQLAVGSEVWAEGRRWRIVGFDEELGYVTCVPLVRAGAAPPSTVC